MINTQLKFEAEIPISSKVVAFTRNYTKFFKFQSQFDLKGQGQGHQFSNTSRATDFPRLRNSGRNNGIRHLKRNPYSVKITVT